jgi:hypothetical protein
VREVRGARGGGGCFGCIAGDRVGGRAALAVDWRHLKRVLRLVPHVRLPAKMGGDGDGSGYVLAALVWGWSAACMTPCRRRRETHGAHAASCVISQMRGWRCSTPRHAFPPFEGSGIARAAEKLSLSTIL